MKHPKISEWADYARAVATEAERTALESHLDEGCELCRATLGALQLVSDIAAADLEMSPPSGTLRSVKAFFAAQHSGTRGVWSELPLRLAFDSAQTPSAMNRRAPADGSRQLLFESERYTVELSLEQPPDAVHATLRGQILEAHGAPRSHAPVFLVGDGEVLDRAISEQQGTFEMSGRLDQPCELWVFPDDESRLRLTLSSEQ